MFLGLNGIKFDYLGLKRRKLRFIRSGRRSKDPWVSFRRTKQRPGLTVRRLTDIPF